MSSFTSRLYATRFAVFAGLIASISLFFNQMAFSNLILARGDTFLYFYPYWEAAAAALRDGRIPLWNPQLFMGAPFLANSQVGFFYPLNWPLWWLLPTPYAVSASILLHLFIAGWGTYLAGRRLISLDRGPAWLAAVLFALGGYLTAQVEHVNQLQGLAWLPWYLVALSGWENGDGRLETDDWRLEGGWIWRGTAVAALFSLQLLAGHTQTSFITGVGVLLFLLINGEPSVRRIASRLAPLFLGVLLALAISAAQLLPTLELAGHSSRQGGLPFNEVLSFSLHPLLLGRSLLPAYGQSLFTEYVAFLPLSGLALAFIGAWGWRRRPGIRPLLVVTIMGLVLALGRFTPLYWLLARLPGFELFRVPARWLAWYGLGMALLAGAGLGEVGRLWRAAGEDWRPRIDRPLRWATLFIILAVMWNWLAPPLARYIPLGPEAPAEYPNELTIVGWLLELVLLHLILRFRRRKSTFSALIPGLAPLYGAAFIFLFLAARALPYNHLTTPEAYFDLRPSIGRLQAEARPRPPAAPPGRLLSLSNIFFDPGDQGEIAAIYADQLSERARFDYTVAIKQKEIVAPNLPLSYDLASVDGFDGGVLPLSSYSDLTQLITPNNTRVLDGRLREYLTAVPEARWLDLFNGQYLITDKTGDVWRTIAPGQDVFFDLQHPVTLAPGDETVGSHVPSFPSTGLVLLAEGMAGTVAVETTADLLELKPQAGGDGVDWLRVDWPGTIEPTAIGLGAPATGAWRIAGLTLINDEERTFQPLALGQYRLLHSGDVKIYENLDVLPRAFLASAWQWQPDTAASLAALRSPTFDPRQTAVLVGRGQNGARPAPGARDKVVVSQYEPERVAIQVTVDGLEPALLLLTDANYPGWEATVDGLEVPIHQANLLFRAVFVPPGSHEVIFSFAPTSFAIGRLVSVVGLVIWLLAAAKCARVFKRK